MQRLRKKIKSKIEGTKEIIENEVHDIDLLTTIELEELSNYFYDDDYERAYDCGICLDMNENIVTIALDRLSEALTEYFEDIDEGDEESYPQFETFTTIYNKIGKWRSFDLYFD